MDLPRAIVLGAPFSATGVLAAAGLASPVAPDLLLAAGLALALLLGAYATLRLRGDLALPLASVALAHALAFTGMRARCEDGACAALQGLWDAFHPGAFGGALAALSLLVASVFAKPLRTGFAKAGATAAVAVLALLVVALGWGGRAGG